MGLVDRFTKYLDAKALRDQITGQLNAEAEKGVQENVEKAKDAVAIDDPARTERLRSRFDRSRSAGK